MDQSVRILRNSIEQSHKNAGDIEQAIRVLKSGVSMAVPAFFVISFLGGRFCGAVPSGGTVHRRRDHRSDLAMVGGMNFSRGLWLMSWERERMGTDWEEV